MNGLIDYFCEVHESGYENEYEHEHITSDEIKKLGYEATFESIGEYKAYIRPIDSKSSKRIFNLTEYPGAYYEFILPFIEAKAIEANAEKFIDLNDCMCKFANKYGLLTGLSEREDSDLWFNNMFEMYSLVSCIESIKTRNVEELKDYIIRKDDKFYFVFYEGTEDRLSIDDTIEISTCGQTPPRDYSEAAYHYICFMVNIKLRDSLETEIFVNPTNTGTDMDVYPKDLLSALWLQFAHMVCHNLDFKQCAACSTFFEVKSKKRRNEKIYCSDRCRVRVGARKRRVKEKAK